MLVFTGTDRLQHRFWKYLVPGGPEYELPEAARLRPALDGYFRALDRALARLIEAAGPETLTIILSDHGFGPVSTRTVHRLSMMRTLGLAGGSQQAGIVRLRNLLEGRLGLTPDRLRRLFKPVLPRNWISRVEARARRAQLAAGAGERAYSVTLHEYVGGIYINRERAGTEADAYETFRRDILSQLQALVDPDTGQAIVSRVYAREELYTGPAAAECPDVVFYLAPGYGLSGGVGPGGGVVSPRRGDLNKQGTHRDNGLLAIGGPGIMAAAGARERLLDVTATILYALDLPIPVTIDSRPIVTAFDRQLVANQPPRYNEGGAPAKEDAAAVPGVEPWLSQEDEEQLLDRLRALGYVE
jgi:predicted AlkP superfamily phosphohydrolase/phosphomutase